MNMSSVRNKRIEKITLLSVISGLALLAIFWHTGLLKASGKGPGGESIERENIDSLFKELGIRSIPTTFILDKQGGLLGKALGSRPWGGRKAAALFGTLVRSSASPGEIHE